MKTPFVVPPDARLKLKMLIAGFFSLIIVGIFIIAPLSSFLASVLGIIEQVGVTLFLIALMLVLYYGMTSAYYRSIRYEFRKDEIVVMVGIVTKSIKHVPFRNITNIEVKRDLLDRMLGIGSLSIQTAGSGGTSAPEENLMGLGDVEKIYQYVADVLRQYRSPMSPTQTMPTMPAPAPAHVRTTEQQVLVNILRELRAIRGQIDA